MLCSPPGQWRNALASYSWLMGQRKLQNFGAKYEEYPGDCDYCFEGDRYSETDSYTAPALDARTQVYWLLHGYRGNMNSSLSLAPHIAYISRFCVCKSGDNLKLLPACLLPVRRWPAMATPSPDKTAIAVRAVILSGQPCSAAILVGIPTFQHGKLERNIVALYLVHLTDV